MKIVIQTQYCENYAWDSEGNLGTGADAYWKFKGGATYIVNDVSVEQAQSQSFWNELSALVEYSNDASKEYVLDMKTVDDIDFKAEDHYQPWETPIMITPAEYGFIATKKYNNDEYGYMRPEIKSQFETWTMLPGQEREDYSCSYEMKNGLLLSYDELQKYFSEAA